MSGADSFRRQEFERRETVSRPDQPRYPTNAGRIGGSALCIALLTNPASAHASFLPPEMMDSAAMFIAWFVVIFVPIGVIALFWMVHVLPEKIAHQRHHPQQDAIHTLCLLSLAFGGLLWPIAWLWAYSKPVAYRMAYGTDKHENHFQELVDKAKSGELLDHEIAHLREELDAMADKGMLTANLKVLRESLASTQTARAASNAAADLSASTDAQAEHR